MRTNNNYTIADFASAFRLLSGRLALAGSPVFHFVVCGGTALVAMGLVSRATRDVDIVALLDPSGGAATRWARTHDPSSGYRSALAHLLEGIGRGHLVDLL